MAVGDGLGDLAQAVAAEFQGRLAVILESSWRKLPAAALRGLAKVLPPLSAWAAFRRSKPALLMYTSPRTSSTAGQPSPCSLSGMLRTVRTLALMSSPVVPSPSGALHQLAVAI